MGPFQRCISKLKLFLICFGCGEMQRANGTSLNWCGKLNAELKERPTYQSANGERDTANVRNGGSNTEPAISDTNREN